MLKPTTTRSSIYPEHIYDPLRRQIAIELVQKELSKLFPSISDSEIAAWPKYFDDHSFWGVTEGVLGGIFLKPMVRLLTARNFLWDMRELVIEEIRLSSKLQQLSRLDGLDHSDIVLSDVKNLLVANPQEAEYQKQSVESYSTDQQQNEYPIVAIEGEEGPTVIDGNRRSLLALVHGQEKIKAWYCATNGEMPKDYWYPIDDMMRLVRLSLDSPSSKVQVEALLQDIFNQSAVAKLAYMERIVKDGTRGAAELMEQ